MDEIHFAPPKPYDSPANSNEQLVSRFKVARNGSRPQGTPELPLAQCPSPGGQPGRRVPRGRTRAVASAGPWTPKEGQVVPTPPSQFSGTLWQPLKASTLHGFSTKSCAPTKWLACLVLATVATRSPHTHTWRKEPDHVEIHAA